LFIKDFGKTCIIFKNGKHIHLYDSKEGGNRFFETDDILDDYIGSSIVKVSIKETVYKEFNTHEKLMADEEYQTIEFLEFVTTDGVFQIKSYVNHNGYYDSINLTLKFVS
jgi:hypothetical protein